MIRLFLWSEEALDQSKLNLKNIETKDGHIECLNLIRRGVCFLNLWPALQPNS